MAAKGMYCEKCNKTMSAQEKPYMFKGDIVCSKCWKRLAFVELASSEVENRDPDIIGKSH